MAHREHAVDLRESFTATSTGVVDSRRIVRYLAARLVRRTSACGLLTFACAEAVVREKSDAPSAQSGALVGKPELGARSVAVNTNAGCVIKRPHWFRYASRSVLP
jgi:hypothetical protein